MNVIVDFHIKEIREQKGISVRKLAELSGISKNYISDIENNLRMPSINVICLLAVALEVRPMDLFSYEVK